MPTTQLNLWTIPSSRQARIEHLEEAIKYISFFKMHDGAAKSSTINLEFTYNNPHQRRFNGFRTQEDIGKAADSEFKIAKAEFKKACSYCEFQFCTTECECEFTRSRIFGKLIDNAKTRRLFASRIKVKEVHDGLKSLPCSRLLKGRRICNAEWWQ